MKDVILITDKITYFSYHHSSHTYILKGASMKCLAKPAPQYTTTPPIMVQYFFKTFYSTLPYVIMITLYAHLCPLTQTLSSWRYGT